MKSRCSELLDRAIAATVAAIEIYNKPDFQYRAETFCILAINGWELLLKAKWLHKNGNKIRSLYMTEPRHKKDGTKSKRLKTKLTRSGNPFTHSIDHLAKQLVEQKHLDRRAMDNIEALLELRDSSVHFYHQSGAVLATSLQGLGAASLKNFVLAMKKWFDRDLAELDFYLMPLSFVELPKQVDAIIPSKKEKNFLNYLRQLESDTNNSDSEYAVTLNIDVKFTRSNTSEATPVRVTTGPDALEVRLTEEQILEKYPWDYKKLTKECKKRYTGFKCNQKYHDIRKLHENRNFCFIRYLNPKNSNSSSKKFYNPNILSEFDERYLRK